MPQPPATHSSTIATTNADQLNMNRAAIAPMWNATMKNVVIQLIGSLKVLSFLRLTFRGSPDLNQPSEFPRYQGRKPLFVILVSLESCSLAAMNVRGSRIFPDKESSVAGPEISNIKRQHERTKTFVQGAWRS